MDQEAAYGQRDHGPGKAVQGSGRINVERFGHVLYRQKDEPGFSDDAESNIEPTG